MKIKTEILTPTELAEFDVLNFESSHRMDVDEWIKVLKNGIVVMTTARTEDNELAAVCVLKASAGIPLWYCFSIAVLPKYRGMRLGSRVYKKCIIQNCHMGKIQAHCAIDNMESIHLHLALGFRAIQYVNDFYGDYEDAILWERER
jgi:ribosomal protein S18 acetylase RimI-like enzyme